MFKKNLILTAIIITLLALTLLGCEGCNCGNGDVPPPDYNGAIDINGDNGELYTNGENGENGTENDNENGNGANVISGELTFGSTFEFDNLEIAIAQAESVQWVTLYNTFSEHDTAPVFRIPVVIRNLSNQTHGLSPFFYNFFAPDGTELNDVGYSFIDSDVGFAETINPNAVQIAHFHILYVGDGEYVIEFDSIFGNDFAEVRLPIRR